MVYASLFGAFTAVGAYIIIPLPLVPVTLQTLFVYLAGALLGARLGALSQVIYILLGIIGLPVFHGGKAGLGILLGPTGGYLIGFILAAGLIGICTSLKKRPNFIWLILFLIIGTLAIYVPGVLQLALLAKLSLKKALAVGVLPFLIGDSLKILVAVGLVVKLREKIKPGFSA